MTLRHLAIIAGLAALYFLTARLGLGADAIGGFASLVWPPSGISLAAVLVFGWRVSPGITIGSFAANLATGAPPVVALGIALGSTLEAVSAAVVLRYFGGFRHLFERLRQILVLIVFGGCVSTAISATIGVSCLVAGNLLPSHRVGDAWRAWWIGDMLGDLVLTPLLVAWGRRDGTRTIPFARERSLEGAGLLLFVAASTSVIFFHRPSTTGFESLLHSYLLFPIVIWAALRFELVGAITATFVVVCLAIWGTLLGLGPFADASRATALLSLQMFMCSLAITMLVLGAVSLERAQSLQSSEDLLAIVSHDLKSPLTAIQLSSGALLRRLTTDDPDEKNRKQILLIQQSTKRMHALIEGLLDRAAIEASRLALRPESVNVDHLLNEAREAFLLQAHTKNQRLTAHSSGSPLFLRCDRERMLQVFSNLIGNAIKFTPAGGSIAIGAALSPGGRVRFHVADSGPGIDSHDLPHVFERFWRASRARRAAGTGLGLSIAKGIVEAHGGDIQVESTPGKGTTFSFTIPRGRAT